MPVFGLNQGSTPIMGYNYGAKNRERLMQTLKLCLITAVIIMCIGVLIFQLFPGPIMSIFNPSADMHADGNDGHAPAEPLLHPPCRLRHRICHAVSGPRLRYNTV